MKGISCDTGILNVTFCPLMEETHSEEQEEELPCKKRRKSFFYDSSLSH